MSKQPIIPDFRKKMIGARQRLNCAWRLARFEVVTTGRREKELPRSGTSWLAKADLVRQ